MSTTRTAPEVEAEFRARMGDELGTVFYRLWNECGWLHLKWHIYRDLFGTSPERIALMNRAAPMTCRVFEDSLWDDVLLHICGLTDPAQSGGQHNLTIRALPMLAGEIADRLEPAIAAARQKSDPLRVWRNKRISHRDLLVATNRSPEPLPPTSRQTVTEAIDALVAVLHIVEQHYCQNAGTMFGVGVAGDAVSLLWFVREGIAAQAARHQRLKNGTPLPGDLKPVEPV